MAFWRGVVQQVAHQPAVFHRRLTIAEPNLQGHATITEAWPKGGEPVACAPRKSHGVKPLWMLVLQSWQRSSLDTIGRPWCIVAALGMSHFTIFVRRDIMYWGASNAV